MVATTSQSQFSERSWSVSKLRRCLGAACLAISLSGCHLSVSQPELPVAHRMIRDQLVIYSSFRLPQRHRLIEELQAVGGDVHEQLAIPPTDEPILIYLFEDHDHYQRFVKAEYPEFPERRAIFVKDDTTLKVFAYWGERTGEDLRHEVTHGYIHAAVPNMPLWLDEGLAEYFEVGRGKNGIHRGHIAALRNALQEGRWSPDLRRLEGLSNAAALSQLEYAESWLWVHYLLESADSNQQLLQDQLARLRMKGEAVPISEQLPHDAVKMNELIAQHLELSAQQL